MTNRDMILGSVIPATYRNPLPSIVDSKVWEDMMDSFFGNDFSTEKLFEKQTVPYDVIQNKDEDGNTTSHELVYCLSGYDKDNIAIDVDKDILKININKSEEKEGENKTYIHKGIAQRSIEASYNISNVNKDEINASFKDGVLKIDLPVKQELLEKPMTIKIK